MRTVSMGAYLNFGKISPLILLGFLICLCAPLEVLAAPNSAANDRASEAVGEVYVVTAASAVIYNSPSEGARSTSTLARGRRVQSAGTEQNGFIPVMTRTGARAWIKASELTPELNSGTDVAEPPAQPAKRAAPMRPQRARSAGGGFGLKKITYDLGISGGSTGSVNYTEANLGFNVYVADWLAWRNAIFGRFSSSTTIYGLDSSVRGILDLAILTAFAGPGWRIVNQGVSAPLVEAGAVVKLAGLSIGGGVKTILNSWAAPGLQNDTQYFIILAGGGSL